MASLTASGEFTATRAGERYNMVVPYAQALPAAPTSITLAAMKQVNVDGRSIVASNITRQSFVLRWSATAPGVSQLTVEATLHDV